MWHYIYILRDPRDMAIRYVGRTLEPMRKRMNHHLWRGTSPRWPSIDRSPKHFWIEELRSEGFVPVMQQVDCLELPSSTPTAEIRQLERAWINHLLNIGCNLLNVNEVPAENRQRAFAQYPQSAEAKRRGYKA